MGVIVEDSGIVVDVGADQPPAEERHVVPSGGEAEFMAAVPAEADIVARESLKGPGNVGQHALVLKGNFYPFLGGIFHQPGEAFTADVGDGGRLHAGGQMDDRNAGTRDDTVVNAVQKLIQHNGPTFVVEPDIVDMPERGMQCLADDAVFGTKISDSGLTLGIHHAGEDAGEAEACDLAQIFFISKAFGSVEIDADFSHDRFHLSVRIRSLFGHYITVRREFQLHFLLFSRKYAIIKEKTEADMQNPIDLRALLAQMTLDEKIGQLIQINAQFFGDSEAEITGPLQKLGIAEADLPNIGSTLNFHGAGEMIAVQKKHMAADRNRIPMLFMMDVIHGYRTIYPIPLGMGATFNPAIVAECTRMAAREASAGGIQVTFTPMVDYVRDARWGRVMETCGEDPLVNSVMGAAQVRAFQGDDLRDPDNLAACVKHFAAYGGAEAGRDYNTVEISERLLRECYLPAYKACIDAGVRMLMPSFNSLNGVPAIANRWLMQTVLKDEWGFDGVVISDYNAIGELKKHGIYAHSRDAAKAAFDRGCDIEMMSSAYYNHLKSLIEDGTFPESKLDDAVLRVLELKRDLGMFDDPFRGASPEKEAAVCLTPAHREIARRAAEEAAVLLKNDGLLPFAGTAKKIAIVGPFADSHAIKGFWSCNGRDEECVTIAEGVRRLCPDAEITVVPGCSAEWNELDDSGFGEAIAAAGQADIVILCVGEPQKYSGEGNSRADLDLPGVQLELAQAVTAANPNTAAVVFSGRPLTLCGLDACAPAILEMWFPGSEGGSAAANLLFGCTNPSGKLTMSFPKAVGQCPIYYNHPTTGRPKTKPEDVHQPYASNYIGCGNLPLYSFGHGLSYTTFAYESLELSAGEMTADGSITVSITVANTGERTGKEVVQLYLRDRFASVVRPVCQLIAFEKIELAPGERRTVTFTVTEPMLRFWDADCRFISEPGEFALSCGYADHLQLTKTFTLI